VAGPNGKHNMVTLQEEAKRQDSVKLVAAAIRGDISMVKELIDARGVNVDTTDAVRCCFLCGVVPFPSRLTGCNVWTHVLPQLGQTALHHAAYNGKRKVVKYLLGHGANADAETNVSLQRLLVSFHAQHG